MYVDGGTSSEVLYEHYFVRLRPEIRTQMIPATTSLIGFNGETIWPIGQISLLVKICDEEHSTSAWMNFMVIRSPSQHNGIIGRTGIRKICAVPSTTHGMLKFPVKGGTVMIRSNIVIPMECAMIFGPSTQHPVTSQMLEEEIKVAIHPKYPEHTIAIGSTLTEKGRKELYALLRQNLDPGGSGKIGRCRNHERSPLSQLAIQPSHGQETRWELANVRGFQRSKQSMPLGWLSLAGDRLESRVSLRIPFSVLPGRIQREGMFLNYKVNVEGLKVWPDKADAVLSLPSLGCLKDVQKLNGKLASLNRFLSKSAEKSLPFFKTLKKCIKKSDFQWT
ncbi:hypothetical protein Tco_0427958 [Tanacetum coccineum]